MKAATAALAVLTALGLVADAGSAGTGGSGPAGASASPATAPATAVVEAPRMSAAAAAALEAWRTRRLARLQAPDGWLSLVGLEWLEEGPNRLGSAPDAEVQFPARAPARLGTITRRGEALTLEPAAGVPLTIDGQPLTAPVALLSDAAGEPTVVALGAISFYVIQRGDRWAVRIKDSESPVRQGFQGLDYYPVAPFWLVAARFEPAPRGTTIAVPNILGTVESSPSPGAVVFTRDGKQVRLAAIDEGDGRLFIVFGDETNGKGTYGGGRFVYADPPQPGEQAVVVDFNQAYNPPCVFTPYATCPLPPKGNRLPVAVEAGEKLWSGYHHPAGE